MAKRQTVSMSTCKMLHQALIARNAEVQALEEVTRALVDAVNRIRHAMPKPALELLPPIDRIAIDTVLARALKALSGESVTPRGNGKR